VAKTLLQGEEKMKLSKNFTINEFLKTNRNFIFHPTEEEIYNLTQLCENLMQPIREYIGKPILVTTNGGLRPELLNSMIGGSTTSDHISGKACDIDVKGLTQEELFRNVCLSIKNLNLSFKQLILEKDSNCVHISYDENNNKKEILVRTIPNGKYVYRRISLLEGTSL
jgi:zinc D-Ala-D-Ala carboxypeptidase